MVVVLVQALDVVVTMVVVAKIDHRVLAEALVEPTTLNYKLVLLALSR